MKKVLAMLLALCMMLGVAGMAAAEEEIVTLKWVTVGNGMPANYDSWIAQVNEYVGEKIGVNIEMQVIGWGDWEPRRNVIINTNEPYDIIFEKPPSQMGWESEKFPLTVITEERPAVPCLPAQALPAKPVPECCSSCKPSSRPPYLRRGCGSLLR